MERYLAEQCLAWIGYFSGPEQETPEPDLQTRPNIRPASIEEVQAKIVNQLREQHAAQNLASSNISSRPATQTRRPDLREEASSPSIPPGNLFTTSIPGTETSFQSLKSRQTPKSPSPLSSPPPQTEAEILAGLHSELERRQEICQSIERQIETCQKEIRTFPSKQEKIAEEHEKRIADFVKPEHDEKQKRVHTEKRRDTQTAEEAKMEEMRDVYLQYYRGLVGIPSAESVDAFFVIIANREHHVKKAEEANKAARKREVKLEENLYKARCAMSEMEGKIERMKKGKLVKEAREQNVEEDCSIGGHKEGKKKLRRGKGV